ncbi:male-specific lethal 1 homolog isoform X1 [Lissotriton helveticus]
MSLRAGGSPEGLAAMVCEEPGGERLWKSPARRSPGPAAAAGGPTQAACLKQILLLQLDLIEQQQRQLQAREREIGQLRSERDTLLARIERMERRMQLVKKDSEKEKQRLFHETEVKGEAAPVVPSELQPEAIHVLQALPHKPFSLGRGTKGHKRKSMFGNAERKTPVKKLAAEFSKLKTKTPKNSPVKDELSDSLSETCAERKLRSKETPERVQPVIESPLKTCPSGKGHNAPLVDRGLLRDSEELPYLATTEMYLCRWHEPPPSPLREPSPKKEESVAIPSWREHPVEPLIDVCPSEIPENLDDSVFFKRHAKLELDEKRRKRWDIQRIREQRILQRLQLRMYKKKGIQESEPELTSFFPEPDDVESLIITPFLPVVAFGRPLPKLTPQNFELPWLDERSRCRLEMQKKQTPHRTCRK